MLTYLLKVILINALIFSGIFHLVRLTKSIPEYRRSATYATLGLIAIFLATQAMRFGLDWQEIPDGRYTMIAFSSFYLGLGPFIALLSAMLLFNLLVFPHRLIGLAIIKLTLGIIFYFLGKKFYKKGIRMTQLQLFIAVILIVVIPLLLSNLLFPQEVYVQMANNNILIIIVTLSALVFTIFQSIEIEVARQHYIEQIEEDKRDLQFQNEEIVALNEEMKATEETLRDNFDALEDYKNRVEHYAFHDPQTGFFNRDYLLSLLRTNYEKQLKPAYILLSIHLVEHHDYQEKLGQTLYEMLHYHIGITLQSIVDTWPLKEGMQLFSISFGGFGALVNHARPAELSNFCAQVNEKLQYFELVNSMPISALITIGGLEVFGDILPHL